MLQGYSTQSSRSSHGQTGFAAETKFLNIEDMQRKEFVLQYQLHNWVENLANVSTRTSGRSIGKVFNPVVKLVLENQPFLMPEPAEKPSLH